MSNTSYLTDAILCKTTSGKLALHGQIVSDDRFTKGSFITTTPIIGIEDDNTIITTTGSRYKLIANTEECKSVEEYLINNENSISDILNQIRYYTKCITLDILL